MHSKEPTSYQDENIVSSAWKHAAVLSNLRTLYRSFMEEYIIYIAREPDTWIPRYVGVGKKHKLQCKQRFHHVNSSKSHNEYLNKHITEKGPLHVSVHTVRCTAEQIYDLEIRTIKRLGRIRNSVYREINEGPLYNLRHGGIGGGGCGNVSGKK
ncbi:MAG: hypothetical protein HRU26_16620 [Psychroserpens sp.]|nr:hypothetical protein [Psychroserpens sp.]